MARVTFFGSFQDIAGWRSRDVAGGSLGDIRRFVARENEELGRRLGFASTLVIVNEVFVGRGTNADELPIGDHDDVAFGPPVSGG